MISTHTKETLRKEALACRLSLAPGFRARAAEDMKEVFLQNAPLSPGSIVAGYWPVKGEIDVLPLLRALAGRGHVCALPRIEKKGAPLIFLPWDEETPLQPGVFGIMEPATAKDAAVFPDVLLLPLLAFDGKGRRLGYGQGYYDRTLQHLETEGHAPLAVGVAFASQQSDEVPAEPHDRKMDYVVTEKAIYKTGECG